MSSLMRTGGQALPLIPKSYEELQRMARLFLASKTFKPSYKADEDQAFAECCIIIQRGLDVGLSPTQAVEGITIINGKTLIYGETLTALLLQGGCKIEKWTSGEGDDRVGHARITRPDGAVIEKSYTVRQAKDARLWSPQPRIRKNGKNGSTYEADNDSPWHRFPERMLEWRALGFAVKDGASDFSKGLAIVQEEAPRYNDPVDITPPAIELPDPDVDQTPLPDPEEENVRAIEDDLPNPGDDDFPGDAIEPYEEDLFIEAVREDILNAAGDAKIIEEIIDHNASGVKMLSPEGRRKIAEIYADAQQEESAS